MLAMGAHNRGPRASSQRSAGYNPASWADYSGQDFRANHAHPGIDYATLHMLA